MTWSPYNNGETLGSAGSENGVVILDEVYSGIRITLETNSPTAAFAITCGIGGWMVHTRYLSHEHEALLACSEMKAELIRIYDLIPESDEMLTRERINEIAKNLRSFVDRFA